jgi:ATP adenylyltransferase
MTETAGDVSETEREIGEYSERIYNPQRMAYINGDAKPKSTDAKDCPFCLPTTGVHELNDDDTARFIIARTKFCFCVLNLYPYNTGHVMVIPYRHIAFYTDLTADELHDFTTTTIKLINAIKLASSPDGFNIGMNQGRVAGAGVSAHLHQHVIPRWLGDANFFPIIGKTKPMPFNLDDSLARYREAFEAL